MQNLMHSVGAVTLRGEMPVKAKASQIAAACEEPTAVGATITIYNIKARAPSGTVVDLASFLLSKIFTMKTFVTIPLCLFL